MYNILPFYILSHFYCRLKNLAQLFYTSYCSSTKFIMRSLITSRQCPEVYDLCQTFLLVALVKKPTAMQESRASQKTFCHARIVRDSRMAVGFFTCAKVQKRETKNDTSGHCLISSIIIQLSWFIECSDNLFEILPHSLNSLK